MNSIRSFNRQAGYIVAAAALLFATFVPSLVFAAQVTERSIELSSSSKSALNVTYGVKFTSVDAAGAFVIDFCSNSPVIGEPCTAPTNFDVTDAASTTSGFTGVADLDANTVRVTGTIGTNDPVEVDITGIDNPSVAGPLYARIVTYASEAHANGYTSEDLDVVGAPIDDGGLAISITDTVGVSGAVLESMIFCIAGQTISANCDLTGNTAPTVKLGETVGDGVALVSSALSTGSVYTQISTNAASGAVVRLKSNATNCGGLLRAGAPTACDIAPALTTGVAAGEAKFGVRAIATADTGSNPSGTFQAVAASGYNDTTYALNYVAGNATGVTSTYGDPFLDTNDAPLNNKNMQLTFGASVTNTTPAGLYSADLSLVATGKF